MDYRQRLYEKYATHVQVSSGLADPKAALEWGRVYAHYLRGWLPERNDAGIVDLACGAGKLVHFLASMGAEP